MDYKQTLNAVGGGDSPSQSRSVTAHSDVLKALRHLNERSSDSVIVESGKTSTGWWRKWSDGFIEQGGRFTPTKGNTLITLSQIYSDTSYLVFMQLANPDSSGWGATGGSGTVCNVGRTGFTCNISVDMNKVRYWYAFGY